MLLNSHIGRLRIVSLLEGISNILLFFVAMPLKYLLDIPQAVSVVGLVHGVLFIMYIILLLLVMYHYKWSIVKGFYAFIACLIPFGMIWAEKRLFKNP